MEHVRIAVLKPNDVVQTFLDNEAPDALHYYEDELHEYLQGAASTFQFTVMAGHKDSVHLAEGNKLAFRYNEKDYYLNIMKVSRTEYEVEVEAYSTSFELLNESVGDYDPGKAVSFADYLNVFEPEHSLTLGINEVSQMGRWKTWTGQSTILKRLYDLADLFMAELEFVSELNQDHSLKRIVLNVYRAHSDGSSILGTAARQGVGRNRADITLRYGVNVTGIRKTSDIKSLYTAIRPYGNNGLNLLSYIKTEKDDTGQIEYECVKDSYDIRAVQARERFPSNRVSHDRYIVQTKNYDLSDQASLYLWALADLKKSCVPQVTYEVDGYFDTGIGDTVVIEDEAYNPTLYLEARVSEQVRSFTEPSRNKTTFSNFKELESQIDPSLIAKMNALIAENRTYTCMISTDNGIVFKNGEGTTTLTANVRDGGKDMTDSLTIEWSLDGVKLATGKSIIVNASDVIGKAIYRFEAFDSTGILRGFYEVTVSNVSDGKPGKDGEPGADGISPTVKVNPDTSLTITDKNGEQTTPVLKGDKGDKGDKGATGPATGITVSATAPTTKYTGMLWKHTGTVSGLIKNATYRWNGSAWELYTLSAKNIEADTFTGYTFNGAEFVSPFSVNLGGVTYSGTLTISEGSIYIDYSQIYDDSSIGADNYGAVRMDYRGIIFETKDSNGKVTSWWSIASWMLSVNRTFAEKLNAQYLNGYYGIGTPEGNYTNYIRTTQNGIIPYQSGGASALGTSSWPFNNIYAKNIYDDGTLLENKFIQAPTLLVSAKTLAQGGSFIAANVRQLLLLEVANSSERSRKMEVFIKGVNATRNIHVGWGGGTDLYITITVTWSGNTATIKCTRFYATGSWSSGTSQIYYAYTV